jgi:hypothetical protein
VAGLAEALIKIQTRTLRIRNSILHHNISPSRPCIIFSTVNANSILMCRFSTVGLALSHAALFSLGYRNSSHMFTELWCGGVFPPHMSFASILSRPIVLTCSLSIQAGAAENSQP